MHIDKILAEKSISKGNFQERSACNQMLKSSLRWHSGWENLSDDKKEALEMIFDKVSLILNVTPENPKFWYHIAGYGKLIGDAISNKLEELSA